MAEPTLTRTHPLWDRRPALARLSAELVAAGLSIEAEDDVAATDLRVDPTGPGAGAAADVLGTALPTANSWTASTPAAASTAAASTAAATGDGQVIWLGPDEWLATSATADPDTFERTLYEAVAGHGGAAVDVSAQRTALRLRGPLGRELLSFGCALDLRPARFPVGAAAQTTVGLAGVVLLAMGRDDYRLLVRPSFAGYLVDWLLDAAREFLPDEADAAP